MSTFKYKPSYADKLVEGYFQPGCRYGNGGKIAVQLWGYDDGMRCMVAAARLSINTDDRIDVDEFVAKEYAENSGLVEQFITMGFFTDTKRISLDQRRILKVTDKYTNHCQAHEG